MTDRPVPAQTTSDGSPTSPAQLDAPDWKESLKRAVQEFKADRGTLIAAGMGFYWFLAVFPALIAAVGIIGLLNLSESLVTDIKKAIETTLPGSAARTLVDTLDVVTRQSGGSSVVATIIGLVLALWSASSGMVALQAGMDVAYDVEDDRKLVKKRGLALLLIAAAAVLGGIASALIIFGKPLGQGLGIPDSTPFVVLWTVVRWVLGLATLTVLFAVFYYFGPNREKPHWSWISPGGVVATVIWLLASLAFSFYVSSFSSYNETYGSFSGVVVLLLWLYLSAIAIVVGAEMNAELERQGERKRRGRRRGRRRGGEESVAPQAPPSPAPPPRPSDGAEDEAEPQAQPQPEPQPGSERAPAPARADRSEQDAWLSYGR
ncbi:MAG TPA: YihY/virulence factor BrkB family protein [Acidimicrobiales bacterium]|nr:YihY/virulence factor BrkB family protein [Acidimicrobiales bacterium]